MRGMRLGARNDQSILDTHTPTPPDDLFSGKMANYGDIYTSTFFTHSPSGTELK